MSSVLKPRNELERTWFVKGVILFVAEKYILKWILEKNVCEASLLQRRRRMSRKIHEQVIAQILAKVPTLYPIAWKLHNIPYLEEKIWKNRHKYNI